MIIEQVRLRNLFSYRGEQVFDFRGMGPGRNIALVYGRNGYGKTSFLNGLRLLFLGVSDELRAAVQAGRKPGPNQYVLGIANEWAGIFNRSARLAGEVECSVTLVMREGTTQFTATRFWRLLGEDRFDSGLTLCLHDAQKSLEDKDAEDYLYRIMPRYLVPFFIYDGEQVQQLAEANRKGQLEQIEQVLGLTLRDREIEALTNLIKEWKKEGLADDEARKLRELERQVEHHRDRLALTQSEIKEKKDELAQRADELESTERYLESLRAYTHEREEAVIKARLEQINKELDERLYRVAEELPRDIPLLANPELVRRVLAALRALVTDNTAEVALALRQLLEHLPRRLLEDWPLPNPDLLPEQKQFLQQKLISLLNPYVKPPVSGSGPLRLGRDVAERLLAIFQYYERADELRRKRVEDLRTLSALKRERGELQRRLDDVSALQEDERQRYLARKQEKTNLEEEVQRLREQLGILERQAHDIQRQLAEAEAALAKQEQALQLSQARQAKVDAAEKIRDFCARYKQRLKQHYRAAIETAINRHYRALMTGHRLIDRIAVDEDFGLRYLDANGATIGMATISAGMKQLVATALLWALREVTGIQAPVVIDTPLARIDRENQLNLITQYYPNAGEQVILLPTDSELDRDKYGLLAPYVYRQYKLDNPSGEATNPVADVPMYDLAEV